MLDKFRNSDIILITAESIFYNMKMIKKLDFSQWVLPENLRLFNKFYYANINTVLIKIILLYYNNNGV